jgi:uncharacterized membrane protein (DUF485 family)
LSELASSVVVFAVVVGAASLGAFFRGVLPAHHLSDESKDAVKIGIGLIATLAALVLGLLVASAKSSFDTKSEEIKESAAKIILLDHNLRQYGPEAKEVRELVHRVAAAKVNLGWVKDNLQPDSHGPAGIPPVAGSIEEVQQKLRALSPTSDAQRSLQARTLELSGDLAQTRWLLIEQSESSISLPFLVLLVLWLAVIFASLGLFAPRNGTVYAIIFVCALSVSSAIFLILEMDRPFEGLLRISDAPLRSAIIELNR